LNNKRRNLEKNKINTEMSKIKLDFIIVNSRKCKKLGKRGIPS
jgi:hypothetical protein